MRRQIVAPRVNSLGRVGKSDKSAEAIIGVAWGERGGERKVVGKGRDSSVKAQGARAQFLYLDEFNLKCDFLRRNKN